MRDFPETSGIFSGTAACVSVAYHVALATAVAAVLVLTAATSSTSSHGHGPVSRWPTTSWPAPDQHSDIDVLTFTYTVAAAVPCAVLCIPSDYIIKVPPRHLTKTVFAAVTLLTGLRIVAFFCGDLAAFGYFVIKVQSKLASIRLGPSDLIGADGAASSGQDWQAPWLSGFGEFGQLFDVDPMPFGIFAFHAACGVLIVVKLFWLFRGAAFVRTVWNGAV